MNAVDPMLGLGLLMATSSFETAPLVVRSPVHESDTFVIFLSSIAFTACRPGSEWPIFRKEERQLHLQVA
jgi:hypothetical protein